MEQDFLLRVRNLLLKLYYHAVHLPWVDLLSNVNFNKKWDEDYFNNLLHQLSEKLGENRYYWNIFNPADINDKETVCYDLLEDLGDIYSDLKYSIIVYDLNTEDSKENAIWEFKFGFDKHWGDHCINALRVLHYFIQKDSEESDSCNDL